MEKITKDNLVKMHQHYQNELDALENKEYNFGINRPLMPFGYISEMDDKEVLDAYSSIHHNTAVRQEAAKELGIELDESESLLIEGYSVDEWDKDLKLRSQMLKDQKRADLLRKALDKMYDHFSEDDKFECDMAEIEAIL